MRVVLTFFVLFFMYICVAMICKYVFDFLLKDVLNFFEFTMYLASLLAIEYLVTLKLKEND